MSAWSIERQGAPASNVALLPLKADTKTSRTLPGAVYDSVSGARTVWASPATKKTFTLPDMAFHSASDVTRLENLVTSGAPMTLYTDYGSTYTVRATGTFDVTLLDTPDRDVAPQYRVTLSLVEV